ncbi:hypothetical protein TorRG33x02_242590, partial [Trema orientale]
MDEISLAMDEYVTRTHHELTRPSLYIKLYLVALPLSLVYAVFIMGVPLVKIPVLACIGSVVFL